MRVWCGQLRRGLTLPCTRCLPASWLTLHRRTCSTTGSSCTSSTAHSAAVVREVIPADSIVIEEMVTVSTRSAAIHNMRESSHSQGVQNSDNSSRQLHGMASHTTSGTHHATATSSAQVRSSSSISAPRDSQQAYWDITQVDPFARSRVVNFMRRTGNRSSQLFLVRQDKLADGRAVYIATCRLTLPAPHFLYVAEGMAETHKDAELLAAMHAERVCDALGVPLFQLPSMQRKHALLVRQQGRYAPMPEDPVRQDNRDVPPPLRMVSRLTQQQQAQSGTDPTTSRRISECNTHREEKKASEFLFATTITEAELVTSNEKKQRKREDKAQGTSATVAEHVTEASTSPHTAVPSSSSSASSEDGVSRYAETVWYPWSVSAMAAMTQAAAEAAAATNSMSKVTPTSASKPTPASSSNNNQYYDITEQGMWQLVNCRSARCSPSPQDALVLPFVFDPGAYDRIQDYFLQHHLELKHRCSFTHILAAGCTTRMYTAELKLVNSPVTARGKAATKDMALKLAAMHAELLLDALGEPLFPCDAERQARHAAAVARYGRWAIHPHTTNTNSNSEKDGTLPLPLKELSAEDEIWFDTAVLPRQGHTRSLGERMVAVHNTLRVHCSDGIEVNPPQALLDEALNVLRRWQRTIARNPHPELFIPVKMGDAYLASTITPVPRRYGIRGGIAIGKTLEQAIGLCALHAIDSLCALQIPLFHDAAEQRRFVALRRALNMVTHDAVDNLSRTELPNGTLTCSLLLPDVAPSASSDVQHAENDATGDGNAAGKPSRVPPYLPAYTIDYAGPVRLLPNIHHTRQVLALRIPDDFELCGDFRNNNNHGVSVKEAQAAMELKLVQLGNMVKICVQNYLKHMSCTTKSQQQQGDDEEGSAETHKEEEDEVDREVRAEAAQLRKRYAIVPPIPSIYLTGVGKRLATHNIAYLPIPLPPHARTYTTTTSDSAKREILAIGMAPKRKDADRLCFMHAAAMLYAMNEDVVQRYRVGLPRQASVASFAVVQKELNLKRSDKDAGEAYWPRPYIHPSTSALCNVEKLSATALKWR